MERLSGKWVPLDPDEKMIGRCMVCRTLVETTRDKTFKDEKTPNNAHLGIWVEMNYIECQECKRQSQEVINKAGTKRKAIGTKIYLTTIPLSE